MLGIRTPVKMTTSAPKDTEREDGAESAPVQPPASTSISTVRKSIGDIEATMAKEGEIVKKVKTYKTRVSEAAALQQSALVQLDSARNLKGEIKIAVTAAIKRLYELIRDAEVQEGKGSSKRKEQDKNSTFTLSSKMDKTESTGPQEQNLSKLYKQIELQIKLTEENSIKLDKVTKQIEEISKDVKESAEEIKEKMEGQTRTYANVLMGNNTVENNKEKKAVLPAQMHSIIIKSTEQESNTEIITRIRNILDQKTTGINIDRIRKAKDQKVIIGCNEYKTMEEVSKRVKLDKTLTVEPAKYKDPLVQIRGVLQVHTDEEVLQFINKQNAHLFQGIDDKEKTIEIKYRRRARNPLLNNIILKVSPKIWRRMTEAGKLHIELQRVPVEDHSPLVQCTRCLAYGHTRKYCQQQEEVCSHCGGPHQKVSCPSFQEGKAPECINCKNANSEKREHNAFSTDCPTRLRWDALARATVAYC